MRRAAPARRPVACAQQGAQAFLQHQRADQAQEQHIGQLDEQVDLTRPRQPGEDPDARRPTRPCRPPAARSPCGNPRSCACSCASTPETDEATTWFAPVATATAGGMPMKNSKRRDQEAAADAEHARQKAHDPAQPEKEEGVDRNLGDGEVKLHGAAQSRGRVASWAVQRVARLCAVHCQTPACTLDSAGRAGIRRRTRSSFAAPSGAIALVCSWLIFSSDRPGRHVGDGGDRRDPQAEEAGQDHLRHGGHADRIAAQGADRADFGRGLEARGRSTRRRRLRAGRRPRPWRRRAGAARRAGSCASVIGTKRASVFSPISGFRPEKLMWSDSSIRSPGRMSGRRSLRRW